MINSNNFSKLFKIAKDNISPCTISHMMKAGRVSSALITKRGNIYKGICIETKCSLGMCAEKNAISMMLLNREYDIVSICTVDDKGHVMPPCDACREFMIQLGNNSKNIEVFINDKGESLMLGELLPQYPYI